MLEEVGLGLLKRAPWQFWMAVAGVGLVLAGCLAPWASGGGSGAQYGFQSDDGKFFLLLALATGVLLWRYAERDAPPALLLSAVLGILLLIAAGLEFESITDVVSRSFSTVGSNSVSDSWGLLVVVLGGLGITIGSGLLLLERAASASTG